MPVLTDGLDILGSATLALIRHVNVIVTVAVRAAVVAAVRCHGRLLGAGHPDCWQPCDAAGSGGGGGGVGVGVAAQAADQHGGRLRVHHIICTGRNSINVVHIEPVCT